MDSTLSSSFCACCLRLCMFRLVSAHLTKTCCSLLLVDKFQEYVLLKVKLKVDKIKMIKMRRQVPELSVVVTFAITTVLVLGFLLKKTPPQDLVKYVRGIESSASDCVSTGCCPRKVCPADHFPFFLRSGAASVVGPKICFNNRIIMSGAQNNVGWGVNIAIMDADTGNILKSDFFKLYSQGLLDFLKAIQKGNIVLVASYADAVEQLTDEIRELFAGIGSSLIYSVKYRDSWVFAGAGGLNKKSPFEKLVANDEKTNVYGEWPEMGELGGCFPRKV